MGDMYPKDFSKKNAYIKLCDFSDVNSIFRDFHYKSNAMGGGNKCVLCYVY